MGPKGLLIWTLIHRCGTGVKVLLFEKQEDAGEKMARIIFEDYCGSSAPQEVKAMLEALLDLREWDAAAHAFNAWQRSSCPAPDQFYIVETGVR